MYLFNKYLIAVCCIPLLASIPKYSTAQTTETLGNSSSVTHTAAQYYAEYANNVTSESVGRPSDVTSGAIVRLAQVTRPYADNDSRYQPQYQYYDYSQTQQPYYDDQQQRYVAPDQSQQAAPPTYQPPQQPYSAQQQPYYNTPYPPENQAAPQGGYNDYPDNDSNYNTLYESYYDY